jgi:hypothetical protein
LNDRTVVFLQDVPAQSKNALVQSRLIKLHRNNITALLPNACLTGRW